MKNTHTHTVNPSKNEKRLSSLAIAKVKRVHDTVFIIWRFGNSSAKGMNSIPNVYN